MTVVDGRYEIIKPLGGGGFGDVFLAVQKGFDRQVALKILRQDGVDEETSKRFHREAKLLSLLNHPSIALFIGHGVWENKQYTALEFIPGATLQERLRQGTLNGAEIKSLATGILFGLAHAHKAGVIHRDLKPANIIIQENTNIPKLIDFGLASTTLDQQKLTQEGCAIGSVLYMAPEQCIGQQVSAVADLYSLGCILHQCITGKPPFDADVPVTAMFMHLNNLPPQIETKTESERQLVEWIERLMEKDPALRTASAEEALQTLVAINLSKSDFALGVRAGSASIQMQSQSQSKRRPKLVFAITVIALAFVGLQLFWFVQQQALNPQVHAARPVVRSAEIEDRFRAVVHELTAFKRDGKVPPPAVRANIENELEALFNFVVEQDTVRENRVLVGTIVSLPWHATPFRYRAVEQFSTIQPQTVDEALGMGVQAETGTHALSPPASMLDRDCLFGLYNIGIAKYRESQRYNDEYRLAQAFFNFSPELTGDKAMRAKIALTEAAHDAQVGTNKTRAESELNLCEQLASKPEITLDDAYNIRSLACKLAGDGDQADAIKYLRIVQPIYKQALSPLAKESLPVVYAEDADFSSQLKKYDDAMKMAELAKNSSTALQPDSGNYDSMLTRLFCAYYNSHRLNDALRIARTGLKTATKFPERRLTWMHNLGAALFADKQLAQAADVFVAASKEAADPKLFAEFQFRAGTVLYSEGRKAEAKPYLERALAVGVGNELPPECARYAKNLIRLCSTSP